MKKYIPVGLLAIAVLGVFVENKIRNGSDDISVNVTYERKMAKYLIENHDALHKELIKKECYAGSLISLSGQYENIIYSDSEFKESFFYNLPVLYYCMVKDGRGDDAIGGYEIYQTNVFYKERQNLPSPKKLKEFRDVVKSIRKSISELNGEKGFEYGFHDYDIVTPYTFGRINFYFSQHDIELMKKYE